VLDIVIALNRVVGLGVAFEVDGALRWVHSAVGILRGSSYPGVICLDIGAAGYNKFVQARSHRKKTLDLYVIQHF
jgi:hypothetical protein